MARGANSTDGDTRERLLRAGWVLAQRAGLKALTVRAVAAEAQANLGSFVHHFGTREAFVDELVERWYAPMFAQLQGLAERPGDPLAALRAALAELAGWAVRQRVFLAGLVADAAAGEPGARRFLGTIDRRHPAVLLKLIVAAQSAGRLRRAEPLHQMLFLLSSVAAPVLLLQFLSSREIAPPALLRALSPLVVSPASVDERIEWALRGLAPDVEAA